MPQVSSHLDDEIDLFELIEILWMGKVIIALFVLVSALLSGIYLAITPAQYQSKIYYSVGMNNSLNIEEKDKKITNDFQEKFFSKKTIDEWKMGNQQSTLNFDFLSSTTVVDGFTVLKNKSDQNVSFEIKNKQNYLVVNVSDHQIIADVLDYAKFSNSKLTREYQEMIQNQIADYQSALSGRSSDSVIAVTNIVQLKTLEREIQNGSKVLNIKAPTQPEKLSPKTLLILALSLMMGGFMGVVYVLIKNGIQKRKQAFS